MEFWKSLVIYLTLSINFLRTCEGVENVKEKSSQSTKLLNYCCSIGSHLPDCSNDGLKSVIANPPVRGLCRATMRLCCLQSQATDQLDCTHDNIFSTFNVTSACSVGCRVGRLMNEKRLSCEIILDLTNITQSLKGAIRSCCDSERKCSSGFRWNHDTRWCEDINECEIEHNGCYEDQKCQNTIGSYRCIAESICRKDFEFVESEMRCKRSDELENSVNALESLNGSALISEISVDYPPYLPMDAFSAPSNLIVMPKGLNHQLSDSSAVGSEVKDVFSCPMGFRVGDDGKSCQDINECFENSEICGSGFCHNLIGAFECKEHQECPKGYKSRRNTKNYLSKCVREPCSDSDCQLKPKYLLFKTFNLTKEQEKLKHDILVSAIRTKSFKFYVDFKMNLMIVKKTSGVKKAELADFGIKRQLNYAFVELKTPLDGPQTLLLKISLMKSEKVFEMHEIKIFVE